MGEAKRYKAFVSYSHCDEKSAQWVHNSLETYRVPRHLVGSETSAGVIERKLGPIFIDRKELSASDNLTAAVRDALAHSEFLIVVCSPNAAKSPWVNQEITEFKRIRGEAPVRCLIVDGEPHASQSADGEGAECFPPALLHRFDSDGQRTDELVEPIAADLRPQGDGKRMVRLKLVAGLIDVGLDELVQRDAQRRQRRMFAATAASLAGMFIMSVLTLIASQARSDAEHARSDAEQRRAQAEDLIEFMLVDLRGKLGPVDRLEVLDAVGKKALGYYAETISSDLDEDSLARRARTLQLLGEIQNLRGNLANASEAFSESQQTTAELLNRAPDDPQRIYDHAQSSFWDGYISWQRGSHEAAARSFDVYLKLAERLTTIDPMNTEWQLELAYANSNMGTLRMEQSDWTSAVDAFLAAQNIYVALTTENPSQLSWQMGQANTHSWLSSAYLGSGRLAEARKQREQELIIYRALLTDDPNNQAASYELAPAHMRLARLMLMNGEVDNALGEFKLASQLGELRMRDDPENTTSAQITGSAYLDYAKALLGDGQYEMAEQALVHAETITNYMLRKDQSILKWQVQLRCQGLVVRAQLNFSSGDLDEAIRYIALAKNEIIRLQLTHPNNQSISLLLARTQLISGRILEAANGPGNARAAWEQTVAILTPIGDELNPNARADLAWAHFHLERFEQARQGVETLDQIDYRHPFFIDLKNRLGERDKI